MCCGERLLRCSIGGVPAILIRLAASKTMVDRIHKGRLQGSRPPIRMCIHACMYIYIPRASNVVPFFGF